jgi:GTP-binding protein
MIVMALPVVAVVGRPNVGKSTLFNKLIGQRLSIVEDTPGVTRDRIYGKCEWLGKEFMLVDTGGIEPDSDDVILSQMRRQSELAITSADVIIFVTDIRSGVTSNDMEVAQMLMKSGKPVVLCVNKVDNVGEPPMELYEFYNLGLGEPFAVSSVHGHGTGDMLDEVIKYLPDYSEADEDDETIKVAVIGKPNVGKSSIINRICGENRVIVSDIAGTTRDATDTPIENEKGKFLFIDTAGIRRKSKVLENVEKYSVLRAYMAVDRADVAVIVIDATVGFTEQDSKVAGYAHEKGKACVVAVNKWDAIEKDTNTMNEFRKKLESDFSFMSYVPFVFISAKTGLRMDNLFDMIKYVADQNAVRIPTGRLNEVLAYATSRVQPPSDKGRRLKIYYMTQPSTKPPTFVLFVNRAELFHFSYQRYIENQIRETFGLDGTPIVFKIRERDKDDVK